jgi:very-short-patch-repair endonuclease
LSQIEETLAAHIRYAGLPAPEREFRFHDVRKWRFDFAWPVQKLAVECEGAIWTNGRHTRGSGFIKDMDKYNAATLDGWRVLRFGSEQVKSGAALAAIETAINAGVTKC